MEFHPRLDGHARGVVAHVPVPFGEHLDHLMADVALRHQHVGPVGRQRRVVPVLAEEVEERVRDQEPPHRRPLGRVREDVLHVVHVGRPVVVGRFAVVGVEDVEDGVAHAGDAEFAAEDVDAEAGREVSSVVVHDVLGAHDKTY